MLSSELVSTTTALTNTALTIVAICSLFGVVSPCYGQSDGLRAFDSPSANSSAIPQTEPVDSEVAFASFLEDLSAAENTPIDFSATPSSAVRSAEKMTVVPANFQQSLTISPANEIELGYELIGRSYYSNDRRIRFTGLEATFGVEGIARAFARKSEDNFTWLAFTELFLNQPFDRNILTDYAARESFSHNFDIETFQISQLFAEIRQGTWSLKAGKFETPFGRYRPLLLTNNFSDAPFIRTEAIGFRETGLAINYQNRLLTADVALVNGTSDRDTNSSKALISRLGLTMQEFELGGSVKVQDGNGSEGQKEFDNQYGVDFSWSRGRWRISGEVIYDEHGVRRPGLALDEITWGRSLYNRQLNIGLNEPIIGWGYYVASDYQGDRWQSSFSLGEYHPEQIGDAVHDQVVRRLIGKLVYRMSSQISCYGSFIRETDLNVTGEIPRTGIYYFGGLQIQLDGR